MSDRYIRLRDLQVGHLAHLETCGVVRIARVHRHPTWLEAEWWFDPAAGVERRDDRAPYGTWSAYYDDVPYVHLFEENPHHG